MNLIIREGRAEDVGPCALIYERLFRTNHPRASRERRGQRGFAESIAGEELWVAEQEDGIAGLVTIWRPDAFIHHLYIDPSWQRRGIGRALLGLALRRCGGHADLKCDEANRAAHAFYREMGFWPSGWGWAPYGPWIRFRY